MTEQKVREQLRNKLQEFLTPEVIELDPATDVIVNIIMSCTYDNDWDKLATCLIDFLQTRLKPENDKEINLLKN